LEFIGLANPLESCLTEDPIQVMLSGKVEPMRKAEAALRGAPFAESFALAVTCYESKDFSMIDVINSVCSKGSSLAEWAGLRGFTREEVMAIGDNHNDLEMLSFAGIPECKCSIAKATPFRRCVPVSCQPKGFQRRHAFPITTGMPAKESISRSLWLSPMANHFFGGESAQARPFRQ